MSAPLINAQSDATGDAAASIVTAAASDSSSSYTPLDVRHYASALNLRRAPAALHSMMPLMKLPGMISLAGGLPNPAMFPFKQIGFGLADGTRIELSPAELNDALQYCPTPGLPQAVQLIAELQQREHNPPYPYSGGNGDGAKEEGGWSVSLATGSSDVMAQVFDLLVEAGDNVLVESPTYAGALAPLRPLQANLIEIPVDECGINPERLEAVLDSFAADPSRGRKPKLLYVIPTGQNPAGCTLSDERKKRIYALACKHDFIILEDDPYYYVVSVSLFLLRNQNQPNKLHCSCTVPQLMLLLLLCICSFFCSVVRSRKGTERERRGKLVSSASPPFLLQSRRGGSCDSFGHIQQDSFVGHADGDGDGTPKLRGADGPGVASRLVARFGPRPNDGLQVAQALGCTGVGGTYQTGVPLLRTTTGRVRRCSGEAFERTRQLYGSGGRHVRMDEMPWHCRHQAIGDGARHASARAPRPRTSLHA
jgi:hypothetical protein